MVAFRKRYSEEDIAAIPKEPSKDDDPSNGGTLIIDVTCCPADIAYPPDIELLNDAREKLEGLISRLCKGNHITMLRTYRCKARKDYLNLVKNKTIAGRHARPSANSFNVLGGTLGTL